jgi:hypothetical protein
MTRPGMFRSWLHAGLVLLPLVAVAMAIIIGLAALAWPYLAGASIRLDVGPIPPRWH